MIIKAFPREGWLSARWMISLTQTTFADDTGDASASLVFRRRVCIPIEIISAKIFEKFEKFWC